MLSHSWSVCYYSILLLYQVQCSLNWYFSHCHCCKHHNRYSCHHDYFQDAQWPPLINHRMWATPCHEQPPICGCLQSHPYRFWDFECVIFFPHFGIILGIYIYIILNHRTFLCESHSNSSCSESQWTLLRWPAAQVHHDHSDGWTLLGLCPGWGVRHRQRHERRNAGDGDRAGRVMQRSFSMGFSMGKINETFMGEWWDNDGRMIGE